MLFSFSFFDQGKSLAPIPEADAELEEEDEDVEDAEPQDWDDDVEEAEPTEDEKEDQEEKDLVRSEVAVDQNDEHDRTTPSAEVISAQFENTKGSSEKNSAGWQAIPKPKGHSQLDYSRWDRVDDESSEDDDDEDDDEESQPRYRFRVKTVGVLK